MKDHRPAWTYKTAAPRAIPPVPGGGIFQPRPPPSKWVKFLKKIKKSRKHLTK